MDFNYKAFVYRRTSTGICGVQPVRTYHAHMVTAESWWAYYYSFTYDQVLWNGKLLKPKGSAHEI